MNKNHDIGLLLPKKIINLTFILFMRVFILVLYLGLTSIYANVAKAQNEISVKVQSASLQTLFNAIQQKSDYVFFYNDDLMSSVKTVSVDKYGTVPEILNAALASTGLTYTIIDKQIVIKKSKKVQQELYELSGVVTDELGTPFPGVTVSLKSKTMSDITRSAGDYRITVTASDTIYFSYLGYKTKSVAVKGKKTLNIKMEISSEQLGELKVFTPSNGYTSIPRERATGSFAVVTAEELKRTPTVDLNSRLEGVVAGLNVDVKTGNMSIRGSNNYSSSTPPLVVIDGFPMSENDFRFSKGRAYQGASTLGYINPDDIESISVLKDASAAAIWGSRAANGVIVITTKTGKKSKEPNVSFSSTTTMGDKISLNKLRQMSTGQYVDFEKEMVDKGYLLDNSSNWQALNSSEVQSVMFQAQRGEITQAQRDAKLSEISGRSNLGQINQYLLRNSLTQQYDFSISGGSDKNTYFLSAGYNKDQAPMRGNNSQSYSITFNNSVKLKSFLTLDTGINYLKSDYQSNNTANEALSNVSTTSLRPYDMIVGPDGEALDKYIKFTPKVIQGFDAKGYLPWTYNYLDEINLSNTKTEGNNIRLNAKLTAKVTDWLSVEASGMYSSLKNNSNNLNELDSYFSRNMINEATSISNGKPVYGIPMGGRYYTFYDQNTSQSMRLQLNVNKKFNEKHELNFLAGAETREENREGGSQTRYGYDTDTNNSVAVNPNVYYTTVYGWTTIIGNSDTSISKYRNRFLSYYGLAGYHFKNKYHFSGSLRFDDTNLLGASRSNRALPLWSTGLKWDISKEDFLKNSTWLSNLDARVTYGKSGSSPTGGLGNKSALISLGSNDFYTQLPLASISKPENSLLKWETTATWNFALDYGVFNNRLNGSVDLYYKKSEDILTSVPFNPTYGFSNLIYNTGTLKGHGIEVSLTGLIIKSDFRWSTTLNFAYNKNEVTDSRFVAKTTSQFLSSPVRTGQSLGGIYAYRWAGLDNKGQSQVYTSTGDIIPSSTGIAGVKPEDLKYMGTTVAPYFGGLFNTFSYKNFTMDVRVSYYLGHVFRNSVLNNYPSFEGVYYGTSLSKEAIVADRWRNPGDEATTNVPGIANVNFNSINRFQNADINILPADNIRLQQVSLGYNVPSEWLSKTFFKSAGFSFAVRNLGILWRKNKEGIDPVYLSTNNYNTLPPERNYTLQFNLGF